MLPPNKLDDAFDGDEQPSGHWLDANFEEDESPGAITAKLFEAGPFRQSVETAVKEALERKKEIQEFRSKNPNVVGATPYQVARVRFIKRLNELLLGQ
jgi:hypothetical protein